MVDCKVFSEQRYKCHAVYGKGGEDCLHQELSEKRCLSLQHCPRQAHEYYGDFPMTSSTTATTTLTLQQHEYAADSFIPLVHKGMCASWAESFAYTDKSLEFGSTVAEHHRLANEIVSQDRKLKSVEELPLHWPNVCGNTNSFKSKTSSHHFQSRVSPLYRSCGKVLRREADPWLVVDNSSISSLSHVKFNHIFQIHSEL